MGVLVVAALGLNTIPTTGPLWGRPKYPLWDTSNCPEMVCTPPHLVRSRTRAGRTGHMRSKMMVHLLVATLQDGFSILT